MGASLKKHIQILRMLANRWFFRKWFFPKGISDALREKPQINPFLLFSGNTKIKILTQLQASGKMIVQERCTLRSDQCCVLRSNYYARKGLKQHESTSS